ncbi:hypothetical protein [endosymbiont GvMRE of Glomus versiforme]|uniref:hypothetical protein n=1 Tax=endosymbiont GvMRE of Glomus versiforme TaxID=2039283 RepID=UPI000EBF4E11|nr:hypothetical protein [endosymbiont GvMRE of Glomus versiforme]RHZ35637.1 hypothetical protein GvMRE_IIg39 [endosymbiont GvMRE of Glomus versiforme]
MTETNLKVINNNKSVSEREVLLNQQQPKKLITLKGYTTSQIRIRETSDTPAYCFFKITAPLDENTKHSHHKECAEQQCRECEIPVIFRIKERQSLVGDQNNQTIPPIKKGSYLAVTGHFANKQEQKQCPKDCLMRKSFTAYSYRFLPKNNKALRSYQLLDQEAQIEPKNND